MKIEINTNSNPELTFPLLARRKERQYIVLFLSMRTGIVLSGGPTSSSPIGYYNEFWVPCSDSTSWEVFQKGSEMTLTQE